MLCDKKKLADKRPLPATYNKNNETSTDLHDVFSNYLNSIFFYFVFLQQKKEMIWKCSCYEDRWLWGWTRLRQTNIQWPCET